MSDWLNSMITSGSVPALERLGSFTEQRQRVIANNIANIDTPDFVPADLSLEMFQASLKEALDAEGGSPRGPLMLDETAQTRIDEAGRLVATPQPAEGYNVQFHDGATRNVETEMANLTKNGLLNRVVLDLLKKQYTMLRAAIRGVSDGGGQAE